jgi:SNF2 family DNA or RNA helicase
MIELTIPVDKISYIRTIEGRKFSNGKWQFPDTALKTLQQFGLVEQNDCVKEKEIVQYELSPHLRQYQKNIVNTALNEDCYGVFSDTGTGKTIMGIEIATHFKKSLILCPLSVIETAWIDDCHNFYPNKTIVNCWSDSKQKRIELLNSKADIYIMNYESFKILKEEIKGLHFNCMIVDESSVMKNMTSQITNEILEMIDVIPHRYVLSGCPTPNSNSEIFPQMKFVDSTVFGNNYYGFLAKHFTQDMANPHRWFQTAENKQTYFNRLNEKSVFLSKDDCVDLPEKTFEIKRISMNKEQNKYYSDMVQNINDNINSWSKFEFTAKLMKLREILSGFVINKDNTITDFETEKDKVLQQSIEEIGDKPIIIWCQFVHEIDRLAEKFNGVALTSKTKNRNDIIRKFKNGEIKLLFTHPQLLGKGLTFTNCNYNIYYSLSFSYEDFKQSQDRIHRIGQTNKCTYIILQMKNTIDEKIYSCLKRKGNAVDELYLEMGLKGSSETV